MRNLLFYKYVEIADPEAFREQHLQLLLDLQLKGKVLVANEGINGCVTGEETATESYKQALHSDPRFADLEFKDTFAPEHGFRKTIVRVKPEIVTSKTTVSLQNRAPYIEPETLKQLLDAGEDVVLIDARNNYESAIGKFDNALTPDIEAFREFTSYVEQIKDLKHKKIVTYCTGGIRCEKASAVLRENGFSDVQQLHGGIIRYGELVGSSHWRGKCFVFDTREAIPIAMSSEEPIAACGICSFPADTYHNCVIVTCDKRFIVCKNCKKAMNGCCSQDCKDNFERVREVALLTLV